MCFLRLFLLIPLWLGVFLGLGCGGSSSIEQVETSRSIGKIKFDDRISRRYFRLISEDLERIDSVPINPHSIHAAQMKETMGLDDASPESMRNWLEDRVAYVLGENFPHHSLGQAAVVQEVSLTSNSIITKMMNMGAHFFYEYFWKIGKKYILNIPGHGRVTIESPRTGVIELGEGHFMLSDENKTEDLRNISYSLIRLSTFYHEARHSDGNSRSSSWWLKKSDLIMSDSDNDLWDQLFPGKDRELVQKAGSLGFFHVSCPPTHLLKGNLACDFNQNGPYTVGAEFLQAMLDSCQMCSEKDREVLRSTILDYHYRRLDYVPYSPPGENQVLPPIRQDSVEWHADPQ